MNAVRLSAWLLLLLACPLSAALARVWARQQTVSLGYRLHQAEQKSEQLRAELQKAEIARAAGRTPQKVSAMAKKLGFEPPQAWQVLPLRAAAAPSSDRRR